MFVGAIPSAIIGALGTALARLFGPLVGVLRDKYGHPLMVGPRDVGSKSVWTLGVCENLNETDAPRGTCDSSSIRAWLIDNGGVPIGNRKDQLSIYSRTSHPVFIESIEAEILNRSTNTFSVIAASPPAGAVDVVWVGIDLSQGADNCPVEVVDDGSMTWTKRPYFEHHMLTVESGSEQPLMVVSRTSGDTVKWRLLIKYRVQGRVRTLSYSAPKNEPLVTSDVRDSSRYWLAGVAGLNKWPWVRTVPRRDIFPGDNDD